MFFLDRDLGPRVFPDILRAAGIEFERHVDHFDGNAEDEVWIPAVAQRGWLIVTHDKKIRYNAAE